MTKAWDPIPELQPPNGTSITIIFVQPKKVYYRSRSNDPIFPANQQVFIPSDERPFWVYTRGHATVMACLDQTSWRDPQEGPTWNSDSTTVPQAVNDPSTRGGLWLFWFSILNSGTYQAISQRLGSALNASDRLSGFTSLPLATEQWKVEAERLFETSLARTQIDARNIARGVMASYPGYVKSNNTAPEMCKNTYLFISQGWTNVNLAWSLLILIPSCLIILLAIPTDAEDGVVVLERLLGKFAMPIAASIVLIILQLGNGIGLVFSVGIGLVFSVQTWIKGRGFLKGV